MIHGPSPKWLAPRITVLILTVQVIAGCAVAVNEPVAEPFNTDVFGANRAATAGVYVRVVDVGTALCIAGATRSGWHFVYDAGGEGQACLRAVREIVGKNAIDLLIISHSDVEHMRDVPALLREFEVRELWWTAYRRPQPSFRKTRRAIDDAAAGGTRVRSLRADGLSPGTVFELGEARVTLVAGGTLWTGNDELDDKLLAKSASLVVRVDYGETSLLLTGDTIGRLASWPDSECGFAEAEMARRQDTVSLDADVLVAPNHGANTASSACLIRAANPTWVIFPSGHRNNEPQGAMVARYLGQGLSQDRLLRTDRGDDESAAEWDHLRSTDCRDQPGDDDIEILMRQSKPPEVRYVQPKDICIVLR